MFCFGQDLDGLAMWALQVAHMAAQFEAFFTLDAE